MCTRPRRVALAIVASIVMVCPLAGFVVTDGKSSDQEEMPRYFRIVEGQLLQFDASSEPHTGHFVRTTSGDLIEIAPSSAPGVDLLEQMEVIAALVGGWDKLDTMTSGPGEMGVRLWRGGSFSAHDRVFRVVDAELVQFDPTEPHTGHFVLTVAGHFIEIDPNLPVREQLEIIAAIVGGWENLDSNSGWTSGDPTVEGVLAVGEDGEELGPVAVEAASWASVKAAFLR